MIYWSNYVSHEYNILGSKKQFDTTIYTFDIETTSFFKLNNEIYSAIEYSKLSKKEQEQCEFYSNMYIWQFGINDKVYYGRTWKEFRLFLERIEYNSPVKKYCFVHNLSFEFQFLRNEFTFDEVFARKSRKPIKAVLSDFNIEFRCTLFMSNCSLDNLSKVYNLGIEKQTGSLNYDLLRNNKSILDSTELKYCEYDCLVVYEFIKKMCNKYENVKNIPVTITGFVRKDFKERIEKNYSYKNKVKKAINTDGHIYNLLLHAFAGRLYTCKLDTFRKENIQCNKF